MWHGHAWGFFPFPFFFLALFIVFVVFRIAMFRRGGRMCRRGQSGQFEAEALLKKRLVNGEIGEEEYLRLKAILSK
jgi:uncharacterized membrane protein